MEGPPKPYKEIIVSISPTNCPVFKVKVKINVSVQSDVINQPKSIDFTLI